MLPQIRVELSMRGWWEGGSGQQENRHVPQDGKQLLSGFTVISTASSR